jgi:predicted nucleic acid-binding protein
MVLADTSVWIRFLAGREPYASGLDELLQRDEIVGHEMVFGELLIGDSGGRSKLLAEYAFIHQAQTVHHDEVVQLVRGRRLFGRGVGWVDIHLVAAALVGGFQVWTADARFAAIARELRLHYSPATA